MKREPQDAEALLNSLVEASRGAPPAAQAKRLEQRLEPWLDSKSKPGFFNARLATKAAIVLVGLVGIGVLSRFYEGGGESSIQAKREARPLASAHATFVHDEPPMAKAKALPEAAIPSAIEAATAARIAVAEPVAKAPADVLAPPSHAEPSNVEARPSEEPPAPPPVAREPEVDFLRRAQATLAASPAAALKMAEDHPSFYPRGILAQEREVIAIDALVRLGRRDEASARAAAFRTSFPRSAHLSRVAALTEKPR